MSNGRRIRRRLVAAPEPWLISLTLDPFEPCPWCETIHHLEHVPGDSVPVRNVEEAPAVTGAPSAIHSNSTGAIDGHST